jgi:hypothetical protein
VDVHILPSQDAAFVEALLAGASFGEATERASSEPTFDFGRALVGLIGLGAAAGIVVPEEA